MKRTAKTIAIAFLITISLLVTACSANQAGASPQDEILSEPAIESEVSVDKSGVGTVVAMIDTSFPIDVIDNSEALELIEEQAQSYYAENEEQIVAMYEEKTEEEVEAYIYNDMIIKIIDVYEALIEEASPETYAITLTVEKNAETDSYYVTGVTSYDEASESTTQAATETATTVEATSSATGSSEEADASEEEDGKTGGGRQRDRRDGNGGHERLLPVYRRVHL